MRPMNLVELIAKKRDGGELADAEIAELIAALGDGRLADYQMSAFCMAVFFRGMSSAETVALTRAMLASGDVVDLGHVAKFKVDKHSTGGVGDKISLCLAPLVAACGVAVPMISGRGLGHTGGTLDKLEAIPGFRVDIDIPRYRQIVEEVGVCMIGQTSRLAPADKRIYALRDVTATVESIPLIVASILSKKLAEGIDGLVLDVKVGRGAFMKNLEDARKLATALVRVGQDAGKRVSALLTAMDEPLGRTIGNALETREALEVLHGGGPADVVECTLALGAEMLRHGLGLAEADARRVLQAAIASGEGARVMERMIEAQGGDPKVVTDFGRLPKTAERVPVVAASGGFVTAIDALELGLASVAMGAGRTRAEQSVDPAVGLELAVKNGDSVGKGEPLAWLHVHKPEDAHSYAARVARAFTVGDTAKAAGPLVLESIR
jgi:pyrimidine-nucleoside phosphorylase